MILQLLDKMYVPPAMQKCCMQTDLDMRIKGSFVDTAVENTYYSHKTSLIHKCSYKINSPCEHIHESEVALR